jgi:hypothetical protein
MLLMRINDKSIPSPNQNKNATPGNQSMQTMKGSIQRVTVVRLYLVQWQVHDVEIHGEETK